MKKWIGSSIIILMISWTLFDFWQSRDRVSEVKTEQNDSTQVGLGVGNTAPDFKLTNLQGDTVSLSDYRGEPVLLNFWATWCPPCRSEMPDMESFYKNNDVTVLAVNLTNGERKESDVSDFVQSYELSFPVLLDQMGSIGSLYEVYAVPTSYMIDSDGKISGKASGAISKDTMEKMLYESK